MPLAVDDLYCTACHGYVHPFLERCPACGAGHPSRFEEALRDLGTGPTSLADDPTVRDAAGELVRRYTLLTGRRGTLTFGDRDDAPADDIAGLVDRVARSLTYRAFGATADPVLGIDVALAVTPDGLQLREAPRGPVLVAAHPSLVLSAACSSPGRRAADGWVGIVFDEVEALPEPTVPGGDLLITYAGAGSFGQFSLTNRRGLFATRARPDHYRTLARWLGLLAGIAARTRWQEVGPAAYARELGLRPAGATTRAGTARGGAGASTSSVRAALEELDELRSAKLVTDAEYETKRREILGRL